MKNLVGIERLVLPEKFAGKFRPDKLRAAARRPVRDQNGVAHIPFRILVDLPERPIMNPQLRQRLAGSELEVANRVIAFRRRRIIRRERA